MDGDQEVPKQTPADIPREDRLEMINDSYRSISDELLKHKDGEIPEELARSVAVQWLIRTVQGLEVEFAGKEMPVVLAKHKKWLEEAIIKAREGDYGRSSQYLASHGEQLRNGLKEPEWVERDQIGQQLQKAAAVLVKIEPPGQTQNPQIPPNNKS